MSREQEKKCYGAETLPWLRANRTHEGRSESPYASVWGTGGWKCCLLRCRIQEEGVGFRWGVDVCNLDNEVPEGYPDGEAQESVYIQHLEHRKKPWVLLVSSPGTM